MKLRCPYCEVENTHHDNAYGHDRQIDDETEEMPVSICWDCKMPSIFENGELRKPTAEEEDEILNDPYVRRALFLMDEFGTPQDVIDALKNLG